MVNGLLSEFMTTTIHPVNEYRLRGSRIALHFLFLGGYFKHGVVNPWQASALSGMGHSGSSNRHWEPRSYSFVCLFASRERNGKGIGSPSVHLQNRSLGTRSQSIVIRTKPCRCLRERSSPGNTIADRADYGVLVKHAYCVLVRI